MIPQQSFAPVLCTKIQESSGLSALSIPFLALEDGIFDPKLNRSARSRFNPRRKC
jgi:hypothetical protein